MYVTLLKSKIDGATVTETNLHYEGSLTLDKNLMDAVNLLPGERVQVLNLNNASRIETYVITGEEGSGTVCLNGPAARLGLSGDKIHILAYALYAEDETAGQQPKVIQVDDNNKIKM
jgi:aspartate 1-decarboxylase